MFVEVLVRVIDRSMIMASRVRIPAVLISMVFPRDVNAVLIERCSYIVCVCIHNYLDVDVYTIM